MVVIDDGSSDDTSAVLADFEGELPLRHERQENGGIGAARNRGIALARAPLLLFFDDDDIAAPTLLEEHCRTHGRHPADHVAVLGYTDLGGEARGRPLMHFVTRIGCQLFSYADLRDGEVRDFRHFWGGRSSCKRRLLLERGTFDPTFRFGEDLELGCRLAERGFQVVYNRRARSAMMRSLTVDEFCQRVEKQGRMTVRCAARHPLLELLPWAKLDDLERRWQAVEPCYPAILRAARARDGLARTRVRHGFPPGGTLWPLLARAYAEAFRAARLKGSFAERTGR